MEEADDWVPVKPKEKDDWVKVKPKASNVEVTIGTPFIKSPPAPTPESDDNYVGSLGQIAAATGTGALNTLMGQTLPQAMSVSKGFQEASGLPEYNALGPESDTEYLRNKMLSDIVRYARGTQQGITHPIDTLNSVKQALASDTQKNRADLQGIANQSHLGNTAGQVAGYMLAGPKGVLQNALFGAEQGLGGSEKVSQGDVSPKSLLETGAMTGLGGALGAGASAAPVTTGLLAAGGSQLAAHNGLMNQKDANIATAGAALSLLPKILGKTMANRYEKGMAPINEALNKEEADYATRKALLDKAIEKKLTSKTLQGVEKMNLHKGNVGETPEGLIRPEGFDEQLKAFSEDLSNRAASREKIIEHNMSKLSTFIKRAQKLGGIKPEEMNQALDLVDNNFQERGMKSIRPGPQLLLEVANEGKEVPGITPETARAALKLLKIPEDMSVHDFINLTTEPHAQPPPIMSNIEPLSGPSTVNEKMPGAQSINQLDPYEFNKPALGWGNIDLSKEPLVTEQPTQAEFLKKTHPLNKTLPELPPRAQRELALKRALDLKALATDNALKGGGITSTLLRTAFDPRIAAAHNMTGAIPTYIAETLARTGANPAKTKDYEEVIRKWLESQGQ